MEVFVKSWGKILENGAKTANSTGSRVLFLAKLRAKSEHSGVF